MKRSTIYLAVAGALILRLLAFIGVILFVCMIAYAAVDMYVILKQVIFTH